MTQRVCVLLAHGFEEIEAITPIDVLRRAGIEVTLVSVDALDLLVRGAHDIVVRADRSLADARSMTWDLVFLPGGQPGSNTLRDHPGVQSFLVEHASAGRKVAALCAAPIALGKAGLLRGKRATCYPGFEPQLTGAEVVTAAVVRDGAITTSRGPGTAMELALALVADLSGADRVAELRERMLVSAAG